MPAALHVFAPSFGHRAPAQQSWPDPPHSAHLLVALSQTNGSPQNVSPPVKPTQHASPRPPHGAHVPVWQLTNAAVQATLPPQHASAISPQAPFMQPPFVHVPWPPEQALPEAMQTFELLSQQPPAAQ